MDAGIHHALLRYQGSKALRDLTGRINKKNGVLAAFFQTDEVPTENQIQRNRCPMILGSTSPTLLQRLKSPKDNMAWNAFVERYGPGIFSWCKGRKLQDSDARDVTQEVLLKLVKEIRQFDYDPTKGTFRGWLSTLTRRAVADYFKKPTTRPLPTADDAALNELEASLEDAFITEINDVAMANVRESVSADRWRAFELRVIQKVSTEEVAKTVGTTQAAVHMAVSRIRAQLNAEIETLNGRDAQE